MSAPLVSIAIPCYNAEKWITRCIESALAQDLQSIEVLVVDDGSSDKSADLIRAFGDQIHFEQQENLGGNAARNKLLEMAQGEWIQFLDADDELLPNKISSQLKEVNENTDILYSPVLIDTWKDGQSVTQVPTSINTDSSIEEQWIRWELPQTGGALWSVQSLKKIGGWNIDMPCCQEHECYLRAIKEGLNFQYTPEALSLYRIWSEETVCRKDPRKVIEVRSKLIDDMIEYLDESEKLTPEKYDAAGQMFFEMARTFAKHDIEAAYMYFIHYEQRNLIEIKGPAAPLRYQLILMFLGFPVAEKVASYLRSA